MDFRTARITDAMIISAILAQRYTASLHCFLDAPACMLVSYRPLALTFLRHLSVAQTSKMSSLDGALLPDETSGPQRVFEGDLVVPLMSPWLALADLLRLAQTNRACMREISIGVREIGLTEFEDPATGRITDAVIASISRRSFGARLTYGPFIVSAASTLRSQTYFGIVIVSLRMTTCNATP